MGGLARGATPGGGRRRIACGRAMAGATPGGGRKTTRPLDPPPVIAPGVVGISNRRLVPRVPSRAERSIDTDASPRIAGAAGLPVLTPSAIAGAAPRMNAAAVKATGAHRLDVRSSASLPDAANLMRFTFRPPHILRWPILRNSYSAQLLRAALKAKAVEKSSLWPLSPGPNVQQALRARQQIQTQRLHSARYRRREVNFGLTKGLALHHKV